MFDEIRPIVIGNSIHHDGLYLCFPVSVSRYLFPVVTVCRDQNEKAPRMAEGPFHIPS